MKQSFLKVTRSIIVLAILSLLPVFSGCGAVGPPIAPEDVGIEAKVREQQLAETGSGGLSSPGRGESRPGAGG